MMMVFHKEQSVSGNCTDPDPPTKHLLLRDPVARGGPGLVVLEDLLQRMIRLSFIARDALLALDGTYSC